MYAPIKLLWSHRELIVKLATRDVVGRYTGSLLGTFWSLINPLFMLAVYTFVFGFVFKARWGDAVEVGENYSLVLFAGLIVHGFCADVLNRAPAAITTNVNFVKRVVFPIEVLACIQVLAATWQFLLSVLVLLVGLVFFGQGIQLTWLGLIPLMLPMLLMLLGLHWWISALGVYFRDINHLITLIVTLLLFLSPVFYAVEQVPEKFQWAMYLNPLTSLIGFFRAYVIFGETLSVSYYLAMLGLSAAVCFSGFVFFNRAKKGFADVL